MKAQDQSHITDDQKQAVVSKAVVQAAERMGLKGQDLAEILGVSPANISRLKNHGYVLSGKPYELAVHLVRLFRSLAALTGGDDGVAADWMRNEHRVFRQKPVELIKTAKGLVDCVSYVDSHRAPI